jgi:hypothetical protein
MSPFSRPEFLWIGCSDSQSQAAPPAGQGIALEQPWHTRISRPSPAAPASIPSRPTRSRPSHPPHTPNCRLTGSWAWLLAPSEIFVLRNVGKQANHTDLNVM